MTATSWIGLDHDRALDRLQAPGVELERTHPGAAASLREVDHLPERDRATVKRRLREAWALETESRAVATVAFSLEPSQSPSGIFTPSVVIRAPRCNCTGTGDLTWTGQDAQFPTRVTVVVHDTTLRGSIVAAGVEEFDIGRVVPGQVFPFSVPIFGLSQYPNVKTVKGEV